MARENFYPQFFSIPRKGVPACLSRQALRKRYLERSPFPKENGCRVLAIWQNKSLFVKESYTEFYVKTDTIHKVARKNTEVGKGKSYSFLGNNPSKNDGFHGKIDNLMIWSRALKEDEIMYLLNHPRFPDPTKRNKAYESFRKGYDLLKKGSFDAAMPVLKQALALGLDSFPRNSALWAYKQANPKIPLRYLAELEWVHYQQFITQPQEVSLPVRLSYFPKTGILTSPLSEDKELKELSRKFRELDTIKGIDGNKVTTLDDLKALLNGRHPGSIITVSLKRFVHQKSFQTQLVAKFKNNYYYVYALDKLYSYGKLAVEAKYPEFALQAALIMETIQKKYPIDREIAFSTERDIKRIQELKKLASEQMNQAESSNQKRQDFIDLNGHVIKAGATVPTLQDNNSATPPPQSAEPQGDTPKGMILE